MFDTALFPKDGVLDNVPKGVLDEKGEEESGYLGTEGLTPAAGKLVNLINRELLVPDRELDKEAFLDGMNDMVNGPFVPVIEEVRFKFLGSDCIKEGLTNLPENSLPGTANPDLKSLSRKQMEKFREIDEVLQQVKRDLNTGPAELPVEED